MWKPRSVFAFSQSEYGWQHHRSVYFQLCVKSDSTLVQNTYTKPAKCCTSFGNPGIDFIINVHNSRQCASKVGELVYHLQSLTFHCDGRLLVRLSRCWLIYYLSLFDADCEIIAVTWIGYLIHTLIFTFSLLSGHPLPCHQQRGTHLAPLPAHWI